jgi:SanA protein
MVILAKVSFRKWIKRLFLLTVILVIVLTVINLYILSKTNKFITANSAAVPACYTVLVLGANVHSDGTPSQVLADRLDVAEELYKQGKVKKILLTGDHGRKNYDEVNHMRYYLISKNIPDSVIFTDHAGFDTYNSMCRAKEIFGVDSVIIVTQKFHLNRAVYIANAKKLHAYGLTADRHKYPALTYLKFREMFANVKAFFEVLFNTAPVYGGEKIPINGLSYPSHDR